MIKNLANKMLIDGCKWGNLSKLSVAFFYHADIHHRNKNESMNGLELACLYGHFEVVQYLLTNSNLKEKADILGNNNQALKNAIKQGHISIVEYLLTSPELKQHATLYFKDKSDILSCAAHSNNFLIVEFLLNSQFKKKFNLNGIIKDQCSFKIYNFIEKHKIVKKLNKTNLKNKSQKILL